jgi:cytoskeletal protein CcmA (bactofilin family)
MSVSSLAGFMPEQGNAAYIGAGVVLNGDILVPDVLVIDGVIEGDVSARVVFVGGAGVIRGKINAVEADIGGAIFGEVHVTRRLAIRATGRVEGRVSYGEITLEKGAVLEGELFSPGETPVVLSKAAPVTVKPRARPLLLSPGRKRRNIGNPDASHDASPLPGVLVSRSHIYRR